MTLLADVFRPALKDTFMLALIVFALLFGLPILEVYTFIQVGQAIDVWPTIGLVILTAVLGTTLIRRQGLDVLRRARQGLAQGQPPLREVFDGACLLVAGALLLTPGFVTDAMGFLLIVPPLRTTLLVLVLAAGRVTASRTPHGRFWRTNPDDAFGPRPGSRRTTVVDGDFRDVTDSPPSPETTKNPDSMKVPPP